MPNAAKFGRKKVGSQAGCKKIPPLCRNVISNLLSFLLEKKLQAASSQCTASCTVRNRILACWASYGGTMVTNNQAHRFISYGEMFRLRHENEFRPLACTRLILRISRLAVLRISLIEWMKMWWMNVWEREKKEKEKKQPAFQHVWTLFSRILWLNLCASAPIMLHVRFAGFCVIWYLHWAFIQKWFSISTESMLVLLLLIYQHRVLNRGEGESKGGFSVRAVSFVKKC